MPRPSAVLRLPPRAPHRGALVLSLGLAALLIPVPVGLLLGPLARKLARQDIPKMRCGRMDPSGLVLTRVGDAAALAGTVLGAVLGVALCGGALAVATGLLPNPLAVHW